MRLQNNTSSLDICCLVFTELCQGSKDDDCVIPGAVSYSYTKTDYMQLHSLQPDYKGVTEL